MKRWQDQIRIILVIALITLLPALAILQYRWLGQVSVAERERMQAALHASADHFRDDFDHEITRLYLNFQPDPVMVSDKQWQQIGTRYQRWQATAPYPGLIKEIFLIDNQINEPLLLSQFDPASNRFNQIDWPDQLSGLKNRISAEQRQRVSDQMEKIELGAPIETALPALLIPLTGPFSIPPEPVEPHTMEIDLQNRLGYLIITLDQDYLKDHLIAALANKYFAPGGQLDYHLAIVDQTNPTRIIYRSQPQSQLAQPLVGDYQLPIFSLRFDEFDKLLFNNFIGDTRLSGNKQTVGVIAQSDENISEPGQREKSGQREKIEHSTTIKIVRTKTPAIPDVKVFHYIRSNSDQSAGWQLVLQHRAGSLEAAVANMRWRNLLISATIMILLMISVGLILISSRRAERLAKQQMEFVAGVSHELRTPLAVIRSAGENLADGLINEKQQVKRYGALIESEGRRLTEMVEQILEFAGWQSQRRSYQLQPTDLNEVIARACSICEKMITDNGYLLQSEIADRLPTVIADPAALQRAIQNLISNAVKYGGESQSIRISARQQDNEVLISVTDQGIGIRSEELPHIFEPFYRGQQVISAQIHGSGLGLSLVKQIITACQGQVSVVSEPQRGTTFTIHLPVIKKAINSLTTTKGNYEQADLTGRG